MYNTLTKRAGFDNDVIGAGVGFAAPYLIGLGLLASSFDNRGLRNPVRAGIGGAVIGAAGMSNAVGAMAGLAAGKPSEDNMSEIDNNPELSYLPGVGAQRTVRRILHSVKNSNPRTTAISDALGTGTSALAAAAAGAGIGGLVNGENGAAIGGLAGGALGYGAGVLGALIGKARRRRTLKEQEAADDKHSALASLLVPGVGAYNTARRSAGIIREEDERNRRREEE